MLLLGYCLLLCLLSIVLLVYVVINIARNPRRVLYGIWQISLGLMWVGKYVKVGLLFIIDIFIFPQLLGWIMDGFSTEVFGTTLW